MGLSFLHRYYEGAQSQAVGVVISRDTTFSGYNIDFPACGRQNADHFEYRHPRRRYRRVTYVKCPFFDGSTSYSLGGLCQNGSITQAGFINMLSNIPDHCTGPTYRLGECPDKRSHQPVIPRRLEITIPMYAPGGSCCYDDRSKILGFCESRCKFYLIYR